MPGVRSKLPVFPANVRGDLVEKIVKNEGSSGDIDENKEGQVPGVRSKLPGSPANARGDLVENIVKNGGSSGDVDEKKEGQVPGVRGQGASPKLQGSLQPM